MVTARADDVDKIRGLGFGADDYIEKPFSPSVLGSRGSKQICRSTADSNRSRPSPRSWRQARSGSTRKRTRPRCAASKEYELLLFLARHPNQVFSREDLYELIWGLESMGDNITVAVHVNRLREKVEENPSKPQLIQTVWGVGYL